MAHKCTNRPTGVRAARQGRSFADELADNKRPLRNTQAIVARCEEQARRYAGGELELHDAVDRLQNYATAFGLVIELGQDELQRLMGEAFKLVRDAEPDVASEDTFRALHEVADPIIAGLKICADTRQHLERWEKRKAAVKDQVGNAHLEGRRGRPQR